MSRYILDTDTNQLTIVGNIKSVQSFDGIKVLTDAVDYCKILDIVPVIPLKLIRIKYQKSNGIFSIKDNINVDDMTLKSDSEITETEQIDTFSNLKVICENLKIGWNTCQWYEPNILNVDGIEYKINDMPDADKYTIWKTGEICKTFINLI